ncbi:MAG: DUF883 domain-containing protein [bacterium]|nr:DUF883 domain-containing protein [bacterium]
MNINSKESSVKAPFEIEKEQVSHLLDKGKHLAKETYREGKEKTENLYYQAKDSVNDLYQDGKRKMIHTQDSLKEFSDEFVTLVKDKPVTSVLIASGIGFLISLLCKKK